MLLPSKELLSEVLGNDTKGLKSFGLSECGTYLIFQYEDFDDSINIYELAYKCKEWAKKKQYYLFSALQENDSICIVDGIDNDGFYVEQIKYFHADTEPEAIFKACEWIMDQTK